MADRELPATPNVLSPHYNRQSTVQRVEQRREKSIADLVNSETQYNALLALLIKHYVTPLNDYKTITNEQHKTLFPDIQSIKELSDKFLDELKKRRINWDPNSTKLSDLFDTFTPFFRMYQNHVNNHETALKLLNQLSGNKRWLLYCQKAQIHCQRMPLSELLIKPSEQLVEYDDMLYCIIRDTVSDHPDYTNLLTSYEVFNDEVEDMKVKMEEYKRKQNVRKIERKFKGKIDLLEPHRSFICDGKLWKISARKQKDRIYQFFLFNDILIYASSFGNKYKIHNLLPINDKFKVHMIAADKYGANKHGRIFSIKSEKKSIVVYAETIPLAQQWVRELTQCINAETSSVIEPHLNRLGTHTKISKYKRIKRHTMSEDRDTHHRGISSETLPVWVPDSHAKICSVCCDKFSFTNRKHHCRKCGAVVCGKCSKYKIPNKPDGVKQRCCKRCFVMNSKMPGKRHPDMGRSRTALIGPVDKDSKFSRYFSVENALMLHLDDNFPGLSGSGDDSYDSDFEDEVACLYNIPYYVEDTNYEKVFSKCGHGVGSYMLIPSAMDFDEYYSVRLVVSTLPGFETFKISLFQKKHIVFRLEKKNLKTKDFNDMDKLLKYIENKEHLGFTHPIYRTCVDTTKDHSIKHIYVADMERYPKATALYDYETKADGDLTFNAGDTICVWDKTDENGWWKGVIGDRVGLFPSNYVQLLGYVDTNILDMMQENIDINHENMNSNYQFDENVGANDLSVDDININDAIYNDGNYRNNHHGTMIEHRLSETEDIKQNENIQYRKDSNIMYDETQMMDIPTRYFYNFLNNNKLERYFDKFQEMECSDIRDIEYLMDDITFLSNDIGIKNPIHRKKLLGEFGKLKKKMDEFKTANIFPDVLVQKLVDLGIVTMDILCEEIAKKEDITLKLKIENDNQCNLLWNVVDKQINPMIDCDLKRLKSKSRTEGQLQSPPPSICIPVVPPDDDDIDDIDINPNNDNDNVKNDDDIKDNGDAPDPPINVIKKANYRISFRTPDDGDSLQKDDYDDDDNVAPPPAPPPPPIPPIPPV